MSIFPCRKRVESARQKKEDLHVRGKEKSQDLQGEGEGKALSLARRGMYERRRLFFIEKEKEES